MRSTPPSGRWLLDLGLVLVGAHDDDVDLRGTPHSMAPVADDAAAGKRLELIRSSSSRLRDVAAALTTNSPLLRRARMLSDVPVPVRGSCRHRRRREPAPVQARACRRIVRHQRRR